MVKRSSKGACKYYISKFSPILEWQFVRICVIYHIKFKLPKCKIPCPALIYQVIQGCMWLIFLYMAIDQRVKWYFTDLKAIFTWIRILIFYISNSEWTVSNIFGLFLIDLLLKIWEIYKKCSNPVSFWARKMFFFLNGSEFRQKLIGIIIRVLVRHLCA